LTLIKREFLSVLPFLALPLLFAFCVVAGVITQTVYRMQHIPPTGVLPVMYEAFWMPIFILPFISAGIGSKQMYSDHSGKISAFLCTLATSRSRILTARIIVGSSQFLLILLAMAITYALPLARFPSLVPFDITFMVMLFVTATTVNLACYSIGLLIGFSANRFLPILGSILLVAVLIALVIVKGFGLQSNLILLVVAGAAMFRTWQKYSTASL
ncbi:MAG: hypothetical protein KAJ46_05490, partial [Sedimentisphaerales bacterium]|nr:hypothetical protein [Sedimentisphaerales bacterium]